MMKWHNPMIPRQRGFNLLEVVIGIAIFAIGMLAIASFQGALTRSTAEAQARSVGINLAERLIEERRGFSGIGVGATPNLDYNEIVDVNDGSLNETRHGVTYTVAIDVTDWYYDLATDGFTQTAPTGAFASDYKTVEVTVSWDDTREFRLSDGTTATSAAIGAGSATLTASISSTPPSIAGRVALEDAEGLPPPVVNYTPGLNPDVVSLSLGDNKFKESTLPEPDVIRRDEYVETRWDVITYSNVNGQSLFLRREEFIAVSCECTLNAASADQLGRRPVHWAGDEYEGGHFVEKQYGTVANNQQSPFCDECCRDHHDGGSAAEDSTDGYLNKIDPFRPAAEYNAAGNHKHYRYSGSSLVEAAVGEGYLEVCRLVRDEGFFRVGQDLRQEDLNVVPGNWLDDTSEVNTYSSYVTHVADQYDVAVGDSDYAASPPTIKSTDPACESAGKAGEICPPTYGAAYPAFPADGEFPVWAGLNHAASESEQLRSRALYIDYLGSDLRDLIDCLRNDPADPSCLTDDGFVGVGDAILDRNATLNVLEVIPFFEAQTTFLNKWATVPLDDPVRVTNEAVDDRNTHSRGLASSMNVGTADLDVAAWAGNLGLTDTVVHAPGMAQAFADLDVCAHDSAGGGCGVPPPPPFGPVISGNITEGVQGNPAWSVTGSGGNTTCTLTTTGFTCMVDLAATNPKLTITAYGSATQNRWACSVGTSSLSTTGEGSPTGISAKEVFDLSGIAGDGSGYDIHIQGTACASP